MKNKNDPGVKSAGNKNVKKAVGFSEEERAAMKERVLDTEGENAVLEKIAVMPDADRSLAKRLHVLVKENAPDLIPKTWYGMPAYADKDGKVICFFQGAYKFKARYATLGFSDKANLDDGAMWPTSFALTKLTSAEEAKITTLLKKAVR